MVSATSIKNIDSSEINTTLDKPKLRFEHGKLSHDEFYYHIRLRRTGDTSRDLALSLRIFICPENRVNEERKWIEMDKFRYIMKGAEAVVSRKDKHSSVIRRFPNEARDDIEDGVARTVSGFCECGWPYHMLLPRGTPRGQPFRLCVVATDNNLDTNNPVRTGCGSLSYCGARDTRYPDRRTMGYPFSLPMFIGGQRKTPVQAMREMANFGYSTFTIKNRDLRLGDPERPPTPVEPEPIRWICWRESYQISQGGWRDSSWTGRFRILINGSDIRGSNEDNNRPQARLVFNGRRGSGSYRIRDVTLAERDRSSRLNIVNNDESKPINVTFNGEPQVEVGRRREVRSDTFDAEVVPGRDYFITFTLSDPGLYYRGSNARRDYAWRIPNPSGEAETGLNWDDQDIRRQISHDRPYIYGLDRILIN